jgi:tRNA nucleotidyltransferase (CCA-adding enzyme)
MGDFMFLLETHLGVPQMRILKILQDLSAEAQTSLFLSGGALRDLMAGFPTRDLDFTLEGDALALTKKLVAAKHVSVITQDNHRRRAELLSKDGVRFELRQAVDEKFPKPGAKSTVTPATIYEDLKCRDFTMNAMALSLSRASRGLLFDPLNGRSDLEAKSLRSASTTALYDDPERLLRYVRFQTRFQLTPDERTERQFSNAIEAELHDKIPAVSRQRELAAIASDPLVLEILQAMEKAGLLNLLLPGLVTTAKLSKNFEKWSKTRGLLPFGVLNPIDYSSLLLSVLSVGMTPKEKSALVKGAAIDAAGLASFQKSTAAMTRFEKQISSPKLTKPSHFYSVLDSIPGELQILTLMQSANRMVVERLKKFFSISVSVAQSVTDDDVVATGLDPKSPKGIAKRREILMARIDAKPKKEKVLPPPEPEPIRPYARRKL